MDTYKKNSHSFKISLYHSSVLNYKQKMRRSAYKNLLNEIIEIIYT